MSERNTVAMATPRGAGSTGGASSRSQRLEMGILTLAQRLRKSLTRDHLLSIVRLHVTIVLPDPLRLPLLPGLLSVKGIRVVLKDDHLERKTQENQCVCMRELYTLNSENFKLRVELNNTEQKIWVDIRC